MSAGNDVKKFVTSIIYSFFGVKTPARAQKGKNVPKLVCSVSPVKPFFQRFSPFMMYLWTMHIRKHSFLCVACLVAACVVACSDDSGTGPEIPGSDVLGQDSITVIGEDGQPIVVPVSSATGGDPQQGGQQGVSQGGTQIASSSSKKEDKSHDGPLAGEDPNMVAVDTTVPFVGNFPVIFSEVSPSNVNFKDNEGNDPGWLELYISDLFSLHRRSRPDGIAGDYSGSRARRSGKRDRTGLRAYFLSV